jgi:hypothetical protein
MTNEERDLIEKFMARVGGAAQSGFGSVPASQPNLPAIDPQADQFIAQEFQKYPEARYRVTQMAVVQEAALVQAQNRIQQLQFQLSAGGAGLAGCTAAEQCRGSRNLADFLVACLVVGSLPSRSPHSHSLRRLRAGVGVRPCHRSISRSLCLMACSLPHSRAGRAF